MSSSPDGDRKGDPPREIPAPPTEPHRSHPTPGLGPAELLALQKDRFGGIHWGVALFGWLTTTGAGVLLTAAAAAAGTAFGLAAAPGQTPPAIQNPATAQPIGIGGAFVVLVLVLLAYFSGGYVAGRMARFNGAKQGFAVWLISIIVAALIAVVGLIAGAQFDLLAKLNMLPRLPINEGVLTTGGIIAAGIALAAALGGATLGGLTGMRFHRKIDRAGFDAQPTLTRADIGDQPEGHQPHTPSQIKPADRKPRG